MMKFYYLLALGLSLTAPTLTRAATCSCAGVPLANSINLTNFEAKQLQIGLHYSYHDISELVSGSKTVNDETGRERKTNSYLFQTTYGLNDKWSITGVLSWIEHTRNIAISNSLDEVSSGIGDSLIVLSYAPQKIDPFTRNEWAVGFGLRLPTGKDDNGGAVVFAEDLQPSQGASGSAIWFHYAHAFNQQADWVLFFDSSYASSNNNNRDYSFEDEWNLTTGINISGKNDWHGSLSVNFRKADPHTRFGGKIPNTGGQWIDFIPSVQYSYSESTAISFSARIPISRDLNGTLQFTTKQSFTLSIQHILD